METEQSRWLESSYNSVEDSEYGHYCVASLSTCYTIPLRKVIHNMSWQEAEQSCRNRGATLASIDSRIANNRDQTLEQLKNTLWLEIRAKSDLVHLLSTPFFIGLTLTVSILLNLGMKIICWLSNLFILNTFISGIIMS